MNQINKRIICIQGFTQSEGKPNGMHKLYLKLRPFSKPDTEIILKPWNANWDALAEFIFNTCDQDLVDIRVFAYSWGCGNGFVSLQKALKKRGLPPIKFAVLSDPVYYKWGAWWRAICSPFVETTINAGDTEEVWSFYQRQNKPQGCKVIGSGKIHQPRQLNRTHQYMDDANEFHRLCKMVANGIMPHGSRKCCGSKTSCEGKPVSELRQQTFFPE